MFKRRHPPTDKVARPLEWRVDEHQPEAAVTARVDDPPTVPVAARMPLRLAATQVPPRIAATPLPPLRIAGTPVPRGSSPLITNPLGLPVFTPPGTAAAMPIAVAGAPRRRRDTLARLACFVAGAGLALALVVYGDLRWGRRHAAPEASSVPAVAPPPPARPAATVALVDGRLELSADRREVTRFAASAVRWRAPQGAALTSIEVTGPLALGRTDFTASADHTLVALDLETGRTRFSWTPPSDEHWVEPAPAALGSCLLATTTRGKRAQLRCLDLETGEPRWNAALAAACAQPATAIPGAFVVPCSGATALIDEDTGAVSMCRAAGAGCSTQRSLRP